ncbi:MAG TPA: mycofactocin biosynthesis glycosyltransferase MftF [Acidimicrobiales bacterium]|nr:mycofactocin biosynthesis glycosyltransferase MftF [Acidimicrobiales bacterium]
MPAPATPERPAFLRPAPDRRATPLPGSFTLHPAPSTVHLDGGTVVLGGSPIRLFRISERARQLLAWWRVGHPVGERPGARLLARRLVSSGAYVPRPTTAPTLRNEDVTVVVPVRNRAAQLDRLLAGLAAAADLPCVVVDDASADAGSTKEVAERHGARFVALADNLGPAGARNAGLALVETALVAFVDSDCVPSPEWLGPLLGHFDDPVVGAVAPRVVPLPRTPGRALEGYERVRSSLDRGAFEGPVRRGSPIPYVPSAALVVRTAVTAGPDLFDATLRRGEDVDLVWRLADAGWDVRYVPESTVEHDGPATLTEFLGRRCFYGSSAAALARRHPRSLPPVQVSAWSLAVWLLAAARRPALALTTLAASVGLLAHRLRGLTDDPIALATRIAGDGTVRAALPALAGLARTGSPALVAGLVFRRTRRAAALALVLPALADWRKDRSLSGLDPVSYTALHVGDDVAYGAGVWLGCARERTVAPLVPRVSFRARVWSARSLRENLASEVKAGSASTPA